MATNLVGHAHQHSMLSNKHESSCCIQNQIALTLSSLWKVLGSKENMCCCKKECKATALYLAETHFWRRSPCVVLPFSRPVKEPENLNYVWAFVKPVTEMNFVPYGLQGLLAGPCRASPHLYLDCFKQTPTTCTC